MYIGVQDICLHKHAQVYSYLKKLMYALLHILSESICRLSVVQHITLSELSQEG